MGLFLGASLLTLTEITEFFVTLLVHSIRRKIYETKTRITDQEHPTQ